MNPITEYSDFASRRRRLAAYLLDGLFLAIVAYLFLPSEGSIIGVVVNGFYITASNVVGVSPAKYYLRIMIQTREGERPGLMRGVIRSVPFLLPLLLFVIGAEIAGLVVCVLMYLGYFPILTHSERRSIYDQLAGTWVVPGRRAQHAGRLTI